MEQKATFIRLRVDVREMLDRAALDLHRSRASIAEQAIREWCRANESTEAKLERLTNAKL